MVIWVLGIQFGKMIIYPGFKRIFLYKEFYMNTASHYKLLLYVFFIIIIMLYTTFVIRLSPRTGNFQKYILCVIGL